MGRSAERWWAAGGFVVLAGGTWLSLALLESVHNGGFGFAMKVGCVPIAAALLADSYRRRHQQPRPWLMAALSYPVLPLFSWPWLMLLNAAYPIATVRYQGPVVEKHVSGTMVVTLRDEASGERVGLSVRRPAFEATTMGEPYRACFSKGILGQPFVWRSEPVPAACAEFMAPQLEAERARAKLPEAGARAPRRAKTSGSWRLGVGLVGALGTLVLVLYLLGRRATKASLAPKVVPRNFPKRYVAKELVPEPLPLAADAIGGIETLTIAGKRYWFGYSYSADAILSPLIDDPKAMAQFASDHMLTKDGAQPPEYWEQVVKEAGRPDGSALFPNHDFTGHEVSELVKGLAEARERGAPVDRVGISPDLLFLLAATSIHTPYSFHEQDAEIADALEAASEDNFDFAGALAVTAGTIAPPRGATFADALDVAEAYVEHWRRVTPENWRSLLL